MKYPINTASLTEARMYAIDSINHTYDYDGWEDGYDKSQRIITGKFCQLWLCEYCKINNVPYQKDKTSPYIHDNGDLYINGWNIDCKATVTDAFAGQVSKQFDSNNNDIDYYTFFKTNKSLMFIEPLGFIHKSKVLKNSQKVLKGELIPHTKIEQKFEDYSYFIDVSTLKPFYEAMSILTEEGKKTA